MTAIKTNSAVHRYPGSKKDYCEKLAEGASKVEAVIEPYAGAVHYSLYRGLTLMATQSEALLAFELQSADSAAELQQIKQRYPEDVRRSLMKQWVETGEYEWLKNKYKTLSKNKQSSPVNFWHSNPESWPQVGELVRQYNDPFNNRPIEVVSISEKGEMNLRALDGKPVRRAPMECFTYWPTSGDQVTFLIRDYIEWLIGLTRTKKIMKDTTALGKIRARIEAYGASEGRIGGEVALLMRNYDLLRTKEEMGVVQMDRKIQCPLRCLLVVGR